MSLWSSEYPRQWDHGQLAKLGTHKNPVSRVVGIFFS